MLKTYLGKIRNALQQNQESELGKIGRLPRYTPGEIELFGSRISFPDASSFYFIYKEIFEKEIYKFSSKSNAPLIIDCGANIGISVLYYKKQYPEAKVIAFEPESKIFEFLQSNLKANDINDAVLINKAVWNNDETLHFSNEGADASRISELDSDKEFGSTYPVEAVRLSKYINEPVDFLKLDIEGAEVEVIKEVEHKLKWVENIFIEYHSFYNRPQELDIILSILSRNGFRYYVNTPTDLRKHPFIDRESTFLSFDNFLNIYAMKA
jgi:FkbM family methyltransferase